MKFYLFAASKTVSFECTFPPKPFHRPTPNPLFFIPRRTSLLFLIRAKVYSLVLVIMSLLIS